MAEQKNSLPHKEPEQDELVEKLGLDPTKATDMVVLVGLRTAQTSRPGYVGLYLDLRGSVLVEYRAEDEIFHRSLASEQNPLGGTMVWLRRDAELMHTRTKQRRVQADFLSGDITRGFLRDSGMGRPSSIRQLAAGGSLLVCSFGACTDDCSGPVGCSWIFCSQCQLLPDEAEIRRPPETL
jgi:hypothetical protein